MAAVKWIQFILGAGFLIFGLGMFLFEVIGLYHFKYVLNRMHAAAMGDTLGIGFSLLGLIIMNGPNMVSLKLFLIIVFLWISSPTSSHLIARLEVSTDTEPGRHYREMDLTTLEKEIKEHGSSVQPEKECELSEQPANEHEISAQSEEV